MRRAADAVLLALFAGFAAHMGWAVLRPLLGGEIAVNDFFAHWSAARFIRGHDAVGLYDAAGLHAFQESLAGHAVKKFPFPYPPVFLFLLAPFGALPFAWAYAAWCSVSLGLYLWASGAGDVALKTLAPATVLALAYGQTGLIVAALLVGGLRALPGRPVLAGVLFGLLLIKPQFAVLLPPALIVTRQWRALGAAAGCVAVFAGLGVVVFGAGMWEAWFSVLAGHGAYVDANVSQYGKPTLLGHLLRIGVAPEAAHGAQDVFSGVMAVAAVWAYRRVGAPAIAAGTLAAAPYAFLYDLAPTTNAALALRRGWAGQAVAAAVLAMPAVMNVTSRFTWTGSAVLAALTGLAVWTAISSGASGRPSGPAP